MAGAECQAALCAAFLPRLTPSVSRGRSGSHDASLLAPGLTRAPGDVEDDRLAPGAVLDIVRRDAGERLVQLVQEHRQDPVPQQG
jgi:hypothetical protein